MYRKIDKVWKKIRYEATKVIKKEPFLYKYYYFYLLKHNSFQSALSTILSNKIKSSFFSSKEISNVINKVYDSNFFIVKDAIKDIQAIYSTDPVVDFLSIPLLYFKGFHALQLYRISHFFWNSSQKLLAFFFQNKISTIFSVDIHPAAKIGSGVILDHATGIVIGETAIIENNVQILHSVTLGSVGLTKGDRHPKIKSGAMIGAGAKILGNIEIGNNSKVGANAVILRSIPSNSTVVGIPGKVV
ncbi:serine O-acetyltransferase [Buchnera aphidicola (Mindarus keteleerifoliae)]|uniref:serine O-acetyltransferase n=1 Tax=Buchnera aphidicola TaxID=9 RepID=UPI0031B6BB01